jgi:hypothetical protein
LPPIQKFEDSNIPTIDQSQANIAESIEEKEEFINFLMYQ